MSLDFSRKADSHEPAPVFQTRGLCGSAGPGSREPWQWAEPGGAHLGCRRGGKNQNASVAADSPVTAGASAASQTVKKGDRDQPILAGHQGWRSWLSSDNSMSFKMHLTNSCLQAACQCGVSV